MSGVSGRGGVPPKRSEVRRRRNKPVNGEPTKDAVGQPSEAPGADPDWHPIARDWYASLAESGQRVFMQASDWQVARVWAEILSRQLASGRPSAQMLASWQSAQTDLLTTEGARRRARVELQLPVPSEDEPAAPLSMLDDYRDLDVG